MEKIGFQTNCCIAQKTPEKVDDQPRYFHCVICVLRLQGQQYVYIEHLKKEHGLSKYDALQKSKTEWIHNQPFSEDQIRDACCANLEAYVMDNAAPIERGHIWTFKEFDQMYQARLRKNKTDKEKKLNDFLLQHGDKKLFTYRADILGAEKAET